jgi:hypothetical protein
MPSEAAGRGSPGKAGLTGRPAGSQKDPHVW